MIDNEVIERLEQLQDRYEPCGAYYQALQVAITRMKSSCKGTEMHTKHTSCKDCKHNPPSKKWPCIDCDMRVHDRFEGRDDDTAHFESDEYVNKRIENYDKLLKSGILDCVNEMTNQEAIKCLEWFDLSSAKCSMTDAYESIKMAIKALEQTRWIPVSERLPEEGGIYLVTTTGTNNDIIDIAYYTEEIWHKASRIKAWMPLPETYKAESEEEDE